MSAVHFFILTFVVLVKAQENNQICKCDTEQDIKENDEAWQFYKKLSVDVTDAEMERLYAVWPGSLYQFDCSRCDEKLRKKRKIEDPGAPEIPEETIVKEAVTEEAVKEEADKEADKKESAESAGEEADSREKRYIRFNDLRCPVGYARVIRHCLPVSEVEDIRVN